MCKFKVQRFKYNIYQFEQKYNNLKKKHYTGFVIQPFIHKGNDFVMLYNFAKKHIINQFIDNFNTQP